MSEEEKNIQVNIIGIIHTAMNFRQVDAIQLASLCNVKVKHLVNVLSCKQKISFMLLAKIQKALHIKFEIRAI